MNVFFSVGSLIWLDDLIRVYRTVQNTPKLIHMYICSRKTKYYFKSLWVFEDERKFLCRENKPNARNEINVCIVVYHTPSVWAPSSISIPLLQEQYNSAPSWLVCPCELFISFNKKIVLLCRKLLKSTRNANCQCSVLNFLFLWNLNNVKRQLSSPSAFKRLVLRRCV